MMFTEWSSQFAAIIVLAMGLGAMPAAAGTERSDPKVSNTDFTAYALEKRDEAVAKGGKVVESMDRRIDELTTKLELKAEQASAEAKAQWIATRRELLELRSDTRRSFDAMKDSADETWNNTRDAFGSALRKLGDAIDETARKVES